MGDVGSGVVVFCRERSKMEGWLVRAVCGDVVGVREGVALSAGGQGRSRCPYGCVWTIRESWSGDWERSTLSAGAGHGGAGLQWGAGHEGKGMRRGVVTGVEGEKYGDGCGWVCECGGDWV
jgi:hypothetical protein